MPKLGRFTPDARKPRQILSIPEMVKMTTDYVGSIDQGTTGTRFVLYNQLGSPVAYSYREHRQIYPRPGWVEHDPHEIWENVRATIREAMRRGKILPTQVRAFGVTNQRETTLVWDRKSGQPVANAIVWQCRRSAPLVEKLRQEDLDGAIREKTGLRLDAYFSGTKIQWLLDKIPNARRRAGKGGLLFGNMDTWIIWNLTRSHITDCSNASRTMLFDIRRLAWDDELLELMGHIPESMLPEVRPSSDPSPYGYADERVVGGASSIPVCGDLGDQQAALFGQACFRRGDVNNTYGTGNFILMNTGRRRCTSRHGLISTIAYRVGRDPVTYALEGSIFVTGAAVQWLRDGLGLIENAAETDEMASSIPDAGGVFFLPAFVGIGAPHWNMYARGTIVGLTRGTTRAHLSRAALEAECYQTRDVLEAMRADSAVRVKELKVCGGGSANQFMMQFQADILGIPVIRPVVVEAPSLGAAFAAGLASGFWEDQKQLASMHTVDSTFEPRMSRDECEELYREWNSAVTCALSWADQLH